MSAPSNGTYNGCPVCGWEDDYVQTHDPNYSGGANKLSLNQSRKNYKQFGAKQINYIRGEFSDKFPLISFMRGVRKPYEDELPGNNKHWQQYKCPCCDNYTYPEPDLYSYICPVCYWENAYLKPEYINYYGGEGNIPTLEQARENYQKCGAFAPHAVSFVRKPYPEELPENNH